MVLQNFVANSGYIQIQRMILFICDLIGLYQSSLKVKSTRNRNFEWLHFLWQVVQNYKFAKSQEKPHKMLILNREVRPPTLNFWYFFWFRMVPYGPKINVPGFPKFFSWKVAFLQHSSAHPLSIIGFGYRNGRPAEKEAPEGGPSYLTRSWQEAHSLQGGLLTEEWQLHLWQLHI